MFKSWFKEKDKFYSIGYVDGIVVPLDKDGNPKKNELRTFRWILKVSDSGKRKYEKLFDDLDVLYRSSRHLRETELQVLTWIQGGELPPEFVKFIRSSNTSHLKIIK